MVSRLPHPARACLAWLVLAFAPGPATALDPMRATSQYVVSRWGVDTDLPSNSIHALLQSDDRFLWLGTGAGLVRFDGVRFLAFNDKGTPLFGAGGVHSLAEGADGSLYLGTASGTVVRHRGGVFTKLPLRGGGPGPVESLLSGTGGLWIAALGRPLQRFRKGRAESFLSRIPSIGPHVVVEDASGAVWIGSRHDGLLRLQDGVVERIAMPDGLISNTVQALAFDRSGALWIGTPRGLCRLRDRQVECFTEADGLAHRNVSAVLEDRDGSLWVGTAGGGLSRFHSGRFSRLSAKEGLSDDDVRCLLEDNEGNLWVGTADGLNRVSEGRFITYGRPEGLFDAAVRVATGSPDGTVWLGTGGGSLARIRDGIVKEWPQVATQAFISGYAARDGSVWFGDDAGRLFRVLDDVVTEHTPPDAAPNRKVPAIIEDDAGPVFFVTGLGLARLSEGRFVPFFSRATSLGYVQLLYRDARGDLWICGSRGLGRLRGNELTVLRARDGLPNDRIRWLSEDADGGLWAASINGLAYLKDGTVNKVTVDHGLPEAYLRLVLDDGRGHLWIASMGRIFRLAKQEVFDLFAGRTAQVSPVTFDTSDGLRTTEMHLGSNPGFRDRDGRLWFATAKGVSVVDPALVSVDTPAPPVTIERTSVDGRSERLEEYPPGRGEVLIEYTAVGFRSSSKLRFRHRLEGFDTDWVDAGTRRSAHYTTLPAGRYRFSVMACNQDGRWNGDPASVSFAIRPPVFRTPLFYAACAAVLAAAGALGYRWRVRRMGDRFAAIIGERTRIARELHDTLAQGLAGVGIQIDTALRSFPDQPDLARRHMKLARAMVRSSLAEVRRSIWVLRAQTTKGPDGLGSTLEESLSQLTSDSGLESRIRVSGRPRPLPAEVERNLLRIAHEAVTNAVRHAGARTIAVDLHFDGNSVDFRVKDDGRGFDPGAAGPRGMGDHFGLAGISERAEALGGEVRIASAPGVGTEIACRLPYHCRAEPVETDSGERASL